jgi:hypothetical protein
LGLAGEARVRERFSMQGGLDFLAARFGLGAIEAQARAVPRELVEAS